MKHVWNEVGAPRLWIKPLINWASRSPTALSMQCSHQTTWHWRCWYMKQKWTMESKSANDRRLYPLQLGSLELEKATSGKANNVHLYQFVETAFCVNSIWKFGASAAIGSPARKHPQAFLDRLRLSQSGLGNVGIEIEGTDSQHLVKERDWFISKNDKQETPWIRLEQGLRWALCSSLATIRWILKSVWS